MSLLSHREKQMPKSTESWVYRNKNAMRGRVGIPILLWIAGVPFSIVFLLWVFIFRSH